MKVKGWWGEERRYESPSRSYPTSIMMTMHFQEMIRHILSSSCAQKTAFPSYFLWCVYFLQILAIVFFPLSVYVYYEIAAVNVCLFFYLNYFIDGFLLFSQIFFSGPVGWIDALISSPLSPISYFFVFSPSLSHTHIYLWPYFPTLLMISLFLLSCLTFLHFFFLIPGLLLFYSTLFLFRGCNVFHYLPEHIGVGLCEKFSSPSSVVVFQFIFVFYLFILVPIFWVREFA